MKIRIKWLGYQSFGLVGRPNRGAVRGAQSAVENKVGARSANKNLGWSVERRYVILGRSTEHCFEENMGGALT